MKYREIRSKIIPDYAVIPFFLCLVGQLAAYYVPRFINIVLRGPVESYFDLSLKIDGMIPCIPIWSVIYLLGFVYWTVNYIMIGRESRESCYRLLTADLLSKLICAVIFIAVPTYAIRPDVKESGLGSGLLGLLYTADRPDNLFPSMHCLISWIAVRAVIPCRNVKGWYKAFSVLASAAVAASVLFTKQHVIVDILAGFAVAELCIQISAHTGLYKAYERPDLVERFYGRKKK